MFPGNLVDAPGQYLNTALNGFSGFDYKKTHASDKYAEMPSCWQNTFQTLWSVFFVRNSWIRKLSASAAWNVCNEIYHSKSKKAVMRLAAGSANIITLHWILNERFTFLHSRVRKWLFPWTGYNLSGRQDTCLLKNQSIILLNMQNDWKCWNRKRLLKTKWC